MCSSNDGGKSTMTYINNSNSLIPTMNEKANIHSQCEFSAKICAAENTMKEAFKAAEFSSSKRCFQ